MKCSLHPPRQPYSLIIENAIILPICNPISGVSYVISPDTEKETLTLITFKMSFSLNQEEGFFFLLNES